MANDNKKRQEILDRYLNLPEDLQKALFSPQNSEAIFEIGKKHGLAVDKMGELADETGLVMLGMTKPSEYIKNLSQRLGVEPEKAKAVAEDINQKVFAPIRESLKKIHGISPTAEPVKPSPKELPPLPQKSPAPPTTLPVEQKVEKILKEHEIAKEEKKEPKIPLKIIMPDSAFSTSDVESKKTSDVFPAENEKIPPTSPILSGKIEETAKPQTVPDLFTKKMPQPSNGKNTDPYKEPRE
ncbi:MAG: hypothetical protein AAB556_00165 [Patescibacteria group bacterium]